MRQTTSEDWLKKLNEAIAKGRGSADSPADRAGAISDMKALGLTEGDAEYWLQRRPH